VRAYVIKSNIVKLNTVHPCQRIFRETDTIIIREYNSGSKLRERIDVVFQKIVIGENAKLWKLHLRDVGYMQSFAFLVLTFLQMLQIFFLYLDGHAR